MNNHTPKRPHFETFCHHFAPYFPNFAPYWGGGGPGPPWSPSSLRLCIWIKSSTRNIKLTENLRTLFTQKNTFLRNDAVVTRPGLSETELWQDDRGTGTKSSWATVSLSPLMFANVTSGGFVGTFVKSSFEGEDLENVNHSHSIFNLNN